MKRKKKEANNAIVRIDNENAELIPTNALSPEGDFFGEFNADAFKGERYASSTKKRRSIPDPKTPISYVAGLLCGCFTVLIFSGSLVFLSLFSKNGGIYESVTIPDLTSLTEAEAIALLNGDLSRLNYEIIYGDNSDLPPKTVISQSPPPNTVRRIYMLGEPPTLTVTVNRERTPIILPELHGLSVRDVSLELKNLGVNVKICKSTSSELPVGKIISSSPSAYTKIFKGDAVTLTISSGEKTPLTRVPKLLGLSESEAVSLLKKSQLFLKKVIYQESDAPIGVVIEQSIKEGSTVAQKSEIILYVSG